MNYIIHLNAVLVKIYDDSRLGYAHISLYLALFFYWNLHHFPDRLYANRQELMTMAKIGSKSTYHRILKELYTWGYIEYHPSKSSKELSTVSLSQIGDKSSTLMGRTRSIFESYCPKSVPLTLYNKHIKHNKLYKSAKPKNQLEVLQFFKEKKYPSEEAVKFFNHYQARGWKMGRKNPVEDWKALADNWMIKSVEFRSKKFGGLAPRKNSQPDNLITAKEKNYGEPL